MSYSIIQCPMSDDGPIEPRQTIYAAGRELKEGEDFTYTFANNDRPGTATVTITGMGNYTGSVTEEFEIVDDSKPSRGLVVKQTDITLKPGDTCELDASLESGYAFIEYSSNDPSIADVSDDGTISAFHEGVTYILVWIPETSRYQGESKSVKVTVTNAPESEKPDTPERPEQPDRFEASEPSRMSTTASEIALTDQTKQYTGEALAYTGTVSSSGSQGPIVFSYYRDEDCLQEISPEDVSAVGTYYVKATLMADADHEEAVSEPAEFTIAKAFGKVVMKAKKSRWSVKSGTNRTIAPSKAFSISSNKSGGKVTFKKVSGPSKIKVSKSGKVKIKKGLNKGTHILKVKATSAATANYKSAASKAVALRIKVK